MHRGLLILSLLCAAGLALAGEPRPWSQLTPQERAALAPLASEWHTLPVPQQEKLLQVAHRFASLPPNRQQLLHRRLRAWAHLTTEQRQAARQNLSRIQTLPAADQKKIKQRWLDALCDEYPAQATAPPKR
ncbi:MAG: DUF3106 domain-containing protein [Pseudomonadota bacterium]